MTATNSSLTAQEFGTLFDTFTSTVVRLETLPAFAVGGAEAERLAAFRDGMPRPLRSVRTDPWLARIAASTITAGKQWERVRVVDTPLTGYQRYQLDSYRESQAVGETVLLAHRDETPVIDVWLFDDTTAVVMHYHPGGQLDRRELVTAPEAVRGYREMVDRVRARAVTLNEFLAVGSG